MERSCEVQEQSEKSKNILRSSSFWKPALGVITGGTLGFLYYSFIGCSSGHCAITSNPYLSILYGSIMGYFVVKSPCRTC